MADVIYLYNSNIVELSALTNGLTQATVTGATVGVTLLDSTGTAVTLATGTWPLTMNEATGEEGTYRVTLPSALSLTTGSTYYAAVTASGGTDLQGYWKVPVLAVMRTGGA